MIKHDDCFENKERECILDEDWATSEFYIRPKVHKCKTILEEIERNPREIIILPGGAPDLKGRPIVAGTHSPTRNLGDLIGKILSPIVISQKTYIKDDWDYIKKLPRKINYDSNLFGCDISSLYTSISHELGLQAIEYWINRCRNKIEARFTNEFIIEAVHFLLNNNNFYFDIWTFHQLTGTAMGATFASFYACLAVGFLEETKLFPNLETITTREIRAIIEEMLRRFMDDGQIFLPVTIPKEVFLNYLNNMHPNIQFTLEESKVIIRNNKEIQTLNFLDITIMLDEEGNVETDIYYKPTNTHDYVHYNSFHVKHVLDNIPFNLAKKIIVFVSRDEKEEERLQEMKNHMIKCGYPERIINNGIWKAKLQGPANKPTKNDVITYIHPNMSNFEFKNIIDTARNLLRNTKSDDIRNFFKDTRIIEGISQPKNILRTITQSKFRSTQDTRTLLPGIFAECTDPRCQLCKNGYIKECNKFTTTNGVEWHIKSHINCNSKNVLYYLTCTKCPSNETKVTKTGKCDTKLRLRMNNHKSDCRLGNGDTFDKHVHQCMIRANNYDEPYFEIRAFMKLSDTSKLETMEKQFHLRKYATINI